MDCALVLFEDGFDDGEAEAGAAETAGMGLVDGVEALEDVVDVIGGDAYAFVFDDDVRVRAILLDEDVDVRRGWGVFDGVVEQVDDGEL